MGEFSRSETDIEAKLKALRAEYRAVESSRRFHLESERLAALDNEFAAIDKQAEAKKCWLLEVELAITWAENGLLRAIDGIEEDLAGLLREYPRQDYPYLLQEIQWIKEEVSALRIKTSVPKPLDTFLFAGSPLPGRREAFAELISATLAAATRERSVTLRSQLELIALRAENHILKDIGDDLSALLREHPRTDYPCLLKKIEWIRNNLAVQCQEERRRQKRGEADEGHAGDSLEAFLSSAEGHITST